MDVDELATAWVSGFKDVAPYCQVCDTDDALAICSHHLMTPRGMQPQARGLELPTTVASSPAAAAAAAAGDAASSAAATAALHRAAGLEIATEGGAGDGGEATFVQAVFLALKLFDDLDASGWQVSFSNGQRRDRAGLWLRALL